MNEVLLVILGVVLTSLSGALFKLIFTLNRLDKTISVIEANQENQGHRVNKIEIKVDKIEDKLSTHILNHK